MVLKQLGDFMALREWLTKEQERIDELNNTVHNLRDIKANLEGQISLLQSWLEEVKKERDEYKEALFKNVGIIKDGQSSIRPTETMPLRTKQTFQNIRPVLEANSREAAIKLEQEKLVQEGKIAPEIKEQ